MAPATGDFLEPIHGERLAVLGPLDLVRHLDQLAGGETVRRDYLRVGAPVEM